jgi:6-phosphogluconate dehydrogenase
MAVAMRDLSSYKDERTQAGALYKPRIKSFAANKEKLLLQLRDALYAASLVTYAQGLAMLYKLPGEHQMDISLNDVVKIWRGGCIIRSRQLEIFTTAFKKESKHSQIFCSDKQIACDH